MPNWCNNIVTLRHEDPAMIERAVKSAEVNRLFQEFVPCPDDLISTTVSSATPQERYDANTQKHGYPSWYEFAVSRWGTKWDIGTCETTRNEDGSVKLIFDTAWSPPIAFYEAIEEMGFEVDAHYNEGGCGFAGSYSDGCNDYYEYDTSSEESLKESLPDYLDEMFSVSDWYRDTIWETEEEAE